MEGLAPGERKQTTLAVWLQGRRQRERAGNLVYRKFPIRSIYSPLPKSMPGMILGARLLNREDTLGSKPSSEDDLVCRYLPARQETKSALSRNHMRFPTRPCRTFQGFVSSCQDFLELSSTSRKNQVAWPTVRDMWLFL